MSAARMRGNGVTTHTKLAHNVALEKTKQSKVINGH